MRKLKVYTVLADGRLWTSLPVCILAENCWM